MMRYTTFTPPLTAANPTAVFEMEWDQATSSSCSDDSSFDDDDTSQASFESASLEDEPELPLYVDMTRNQGKLGMKYVRSSSQAHVEAEVTRAIPSPLDLLKSLLESRGCSSKVKSYREMSDYFLTVQSDMIEAYTAELMSAVRSNDLATVANLYANGQQLQCCNKFGESIVHTVARRGHYEMLQFLVDRGVSLRVCCDNGRNPMHDACWTASPNFDSIRLILQTCPDFLLIADNRNLTPLSYVPKECWGQWCSFLTENADILTPKAM